uniref:HTH_48 domain-containing protein n=1 Tax=Haemonchus contortus TaxID=6289 RepID=A0A7I4YY09_HAECO
MTPVNRSCLSTIIFYEFLQGQNPSSAVANICCAFRGDIVSQPTVHRWYRQIRSGNILFEGQRRAGRPPALNNGTLRTALMEKPNATTRDLPTALGCSQMTIVNHLHGPGYGVILSRWVPHGLSDSDKASRVSA